LKPTSRKRGIIALFGILFLFSGCATRIKKPPEILWSSCYQPIEDPQAQEFMKSGIAFLAAEHGVSDLSLNEVLLRYSMKSPAARAYRIGEYFSRTEIIDADNGIFCIYLSVPPGHERFYYLLGHEIAHLLHPMRIDDPEMERFCNEFSRRLCEKENRLFDARWETRDWVRQRKEQK
jgi:hypothetical protein